jgi:hypothetical protein
MSRQSVKMTEQTISKLVDKLGEYRAVIALATAEEEKIRDTLLSLRRGVFTGNAYDATVSRSWTTRLDVKALRKGVRESVWSPYEKRKRVTARVARRRRKRA